MSGISSNTFLERKKPRAIETDDVKSVSGVPMLC